MSGVKKAPDFQKAPNCQKCTTSFGMFTRQHHCRNCGKSYCEKCSSKNTPIPAFGFAEPVRVCDVCFESIRSGASKSTPAATTSPSSSSTPGPAKTTPAPVSPTASSTPTTTSTTSAPKARVRSDSAEEDKESSSSSSTSSVPAPVAPAVPQKKVSHCTCGMPLCICPPDKEEKKVEEKKAERPAPKAAPAKSSSAPVSTAPSTFNSFAFSSAKTAPSYDLKGDLNEQCRDAIKSKDHAGVITLLNAKANPQFIDRTGNSLVHLAAMFDQEKTVVLLIKSGASIWDKNGSGETAVDLAPPSLAHKMKELSPATST